MKNNLGLTPYAKSVLYMTNSLQAEVFTDATLGEN